MNKRTLYNSSDFGKSFALAVVAMLVGLVVLSLLFTPFVTDGEWPDWAYWTMQALYTLVIGSSAFLYAALTKTDVLRATAMNRAPKPAHVGWGCLAVVFLVAAMLPLNELVMRLIVSLGLPRPQMSLPLQVVPLIIVSCFMAAVTEEILFRGTIVRSAAGMRNRLAALALCGALFAVFHVNPAQTIHQFVLGVFLALLALRSGSVWTTVLVHLFNNLLAVTLTFTGPDEAFFVNYWYVFIPVGLVGFAACVFGYLSTTQSSWERGEEPVVADPTSLGCLLAGVAVCLGLWICSLLGVL